MGSANVASALAVNRELQWLDLSFTGLGDEGAALLDPNPNPNPNPNPKQAASSSGADQAPRRDGRHPSHSGCGGTQSRSGER